MLMKRIPGLDVLRAFAVFFVLIEHFGVWFDHTSPSGKIIRDVIIPDGSFGVDLFFVLSGFLITSILLNSRNTPNKTRSGIIKNFFVRRALRIFPIYYLLLIVLFIINYPDVRSNIGYFATYTSNILSWRTNTWNHFSHTWTLAVEEQFYLLWPWLIIFINEKYLKFVLFFAVAVGIISTYIAINVQHHFGSLLVFNCFDGFGIGGIYAWIRQKDDRTARFNSILKIIGIPVLIYYTYIKVGLAYNWYVPGIFLIKTIYSLVALCIINLVVNNKSDRANSYLLNNRPLNYIGRMSYGIYLYHYVYLNFFFAYVNKFLFDITQPYPKLQVFIHDHHTDYWIELSVVFLIASMSYHFIELPILRLKSRFAY